MYYTHVCSNIDFLIRMIKIITLSVNLIIYLIIINDLNLVKSIQYILNKLKLHNISNKHFPFSFII